MHRKHLRYLMIMILIIGLMSCETDNSPIGAMEEDDCFTKTISIPDFKYEKNRYFFVDTYYRDYYEQGFTDNLGNWMYETNKVIRNIEIFTSSDSLNNNAMQGVAVLRPENYNTLTIYDYDTINVKSGQVEKSHFIKLEENLDYQVEKYMGYFWMYNKITSSEMIAISYKTDEYQIGTFASDLAADSTKLPIFRLIKSKNMMPEHSEIWSLMMKNVYYLGDSLISRECFNVEIEYNANGEHQQTQQIEPQKKYAYLLGIDRKDGEGNYVENGDDVVDDNSLFIKKWNGILIFPGLHPFSPLSASRFQIADTAQIYNSIDNGILADRSKFNILVTTQL